MGKKLHLDPKRRVFFQFSNWTELRCLGDIRKEEIEIRSIYFAHQREVFVEDGMILDCHETIGLSWVSEEWDQVVRFRLLSDMTKCTAAVLSEAISLDDVVDEIRWFDGFLKRGARIDDKRSEAAMKAEKVGILEKVWGT